MLLFATGTSDPVDVRSGQWRSRTSLKSDNYVRSLVSREHVFGERKMSNDDTAAPFKPELPRTIRWEPLPIQHRNYFLMGGLAFLATALVLYVLTGYMLFVISQHGPIIEIPGSITAEPTSSPPSGTVSQRDIYNFFGRILSGYVSSGD
jgi:hypothetical protein